jgi:hypothetical protein
MKETHFDGTRRGRNFALDRQTEPLVLDSEISGLENLHAYIKHGNYVARISFSVQEIPATKPKFIERLKDDFIVREPSKAPPEPPKPAAIVPHDPKPTIQEKAPQVLIGKPAEESPLATQATLPFGPRI